MLEDIGLINAELLDTIDIILQLLHDNNLTFGGITLICNGDTNQLPAITGTDTFLSSSLFFNFQCYFLDYDVRMIDSEGQLVLDSMSKNSVSPEAIEKIIEIIQRRCTFVDSWDDIDDVKILNVFGKKKAEREAIAYHKERVGGTSKSTVTIEAEDEMCMSKSSAWLQAAEKVKNFLDIKMREPRLLLLHEHCLLRNTINLKNISQGQVCILAEMPSETDNFISVYVPPDANSLSDAKLWTESLFINWPVNILYKSLGYVLYKNWTVRRKQIPAVTNAAMTCHKLMGDTFLKTASKISVTDVDGLLYVIVSRVKQLSNVIFVGPRLVNHYIFKK